MCEQKLSVFSADYWRAARRELNNPRVLAFAGLVCAISIVLESLPIYLLGPSLKIYFSFLVVGLGEEDFASLSPELAQKYEEEFHQPEAFLPLGRRLMVIPVPDESVQSDAEKAVSKPPVEHDR